MANLSDMIAEIKPATKEGEEKQLNVVTDEIEEKNVAIEMLSVFIDELGSAFAPYVDAASKIILNLTQYQANDSIRQTCASALPGLIKCAKEVYGLNPEIQMIARNFNSNLMEAIKNEQDTESL